LRPQGTLSVYGGEEVSSEDNFPLLFLSPHPDDLALSVGGTLIRLSRAGMKLRAITFFTESLFSPYLKVGDISRTRKEEDSLYFRSLGIEYLQLNLPDTSLRYPDNLLGEGIHEEEHLVSQAMELLSKERPKAVFSPLAIGNHLDHRIVKKAALLSFPSSKLVFYEDLPYASRVNHSGPEGALRCEVDVTDVIDDRERLLTIYRSQIGEEEMELVRRYLFKGTSFVEVLWVYDPSICAELKFPKLI
jgi:Uncharacterized proteins, LmbE homologs